MSQCLDQLLSSKRSAPFIAVNGTVRFSASLLLAEFCNQALKDDQPLIVILTETCPETWLERLQTNGTNHQSIHIIDAYTDPFGWDDYATAIKDRVSASIQQISNLTNVEQAILAPVVEKLEKKEKCMIAIDSIHPLLAISQQRTYQLIKALESLTNDNIRLIVGHRADTRVGSKTSLISMSDALQRLATVIITLDALPERTTFETQSALTGFVPIDTFSYMTTTSNLITKGGVATIEWRRKSGKVLYETNQFYLGRKGLVVMSQKDQKQEVQVVAEDTLTDSMADLSFNLSLTDNQRKAKENVVLPFTKVQQGTPETQQVGGGLIYYEPDAADDFDDEDPDDDLDI